MILLLRPSIHRLSTGERRRRGFLQKFFEAGFLAYLGGVGMAPTESVASAAGTRNTALADATGSVRRRLEELWRASDAATWGLTQDEFNQILLEVGTAWNFGLAEGVAATQPQQAAFYRILCLPDLVLARACAAGNEHAWEHFFTLYRQPLVRAAIAITGNETLGRDLADQLYAELYGLPARDGERRCPLLSYRGRGSLMGWLRTTLAQRHVDHYRRSRREEAIEDFDAPAPDPAPEPPARELALLERAIEDAVVSREAEDRYLLAAYYLDGQTLKQIARVFGVHEATASRKLRRTAGEIRKRVLRNLQTVGLSRRAAEEMLGTDPRDLDLNLKKLLQNTQTEAFPEQAAP
jgi:RNA polymerase sigma-70 factor (ECF subfamily)